VPVIFRDSGAIRVLGSKRQKNVSAAFPSVRPPEAVLVKHPAGDLLIDTGNSSHYDQGNFRVPLCDLAQTQNPLAGPAQAESAASGFVAPHRRRSREVALGHPVACALGSRRRLDGSAASARVALTRRVAICSRPERSGQGIRDYRRTPKSFRPVAAPTLRFEPVPYETFDESADLYRDGSVVAVPLRGPYPREAWAIFVNLSPTATPVLRRRRRR